MARAMLKTALQEDAIMIVRLDVRYHKLPFRFWQILRYQVALDGTWHAAGNPAWVCPLRFGGIEDCVRYARIAVFRYLENRQHVQIPDRFEWRIYDHDALTLCATCQNPLHRGVRLGWRLTAVELSQSQCANCTNLPPPQPTAAQFPLALIRVPSHLDSTLT
jgi:hypothetical protein